MPFGSYEDPRPRHEQIAAELRAQIMAGDLKAGDELPSLKTFAEEVFKASIPTVQRALGLLRDEGFIESSPGKYTKVRDRDLLKISATSWIELSPDGYQYTGLAVSEVCPPADAAAVLGLADGEEAVVRHRVLTYKGVPAEISWAYYRQSLARGTDLMRSKLLKDGVPRVFRELGLPYKDPQDTLSWREPTPTEARLLAIPAHVPVLRALRVFRDADGVATEASVLVKPGHLYEMIYRLSEY